MKEKTSKLLRRSLVWFVGALFCLVSLVGTPIIGSWIPPEFGFQRQVDPLTKETLHELDFLGLLDKAPRGVVTKLLDYRRSTGLTVGQVLGDPKWSQKFGLVSESYKATWYMANPFELLPADLQEAIRQRKIPFKSRTHVWQWCRIHKVPRKWRKALYAALIETTPNNLWRASRGQKSYTKSGRFLEPIVIDHGQGNMEIHHGHIATDPRVIPTNSEVLLLVRIQGEQRILKVKATDIGGKIKGKHVDLPIRVAPDAELLPHTRLPSNEIRNRTVRILKQI